ncbi:MAG TPA: hypothetical protein VKR52_13375 [Terracidiphilus sp.]|nr:hypothetical protein [Terracidiphilus sp.]
MSASVKGQRKRKSLYRRYRSIWIISILFCLIMLAAVILMAATDNWNWLLDNPSSKTTIHESVQPITD